jgi:hypothetical protein
MLKAIPLKLHRNLTINSKKAEGILTLTIKDEYLKKTPWL